MKLLIIDDEELIQQDIYNIIVSSNFNFNEIHSALDADTALKIIKNNNPEIILTDIQMPSKSGLDILQYVVTNELDSIVICITGYSDFEYVQTALRFQAFDYLLKPIDKEKLLSCLQKAINTFQDKMKNKEFSLILKKYYKENYDILKKQFIDNLILSPINQDPSYIKNQAAMFHINLLSYRLIAIRCNQTIDNLLPNQQYYIAYTLSKKLENKYSNVSCSYIGNTIYMIWECPSDNSKTEISKLTQTIYSIAEYAQTIYFTNIIVGVSQVAMDICEIGNLFHQVSFCLDLSSNSRETSIVFYDELESHNSKYMRTNNAITQLIKSIQVKNEKEALRNASVLLKHIEYLPIEQQKKTISIISMNINLLLGNMGITENEINNLCDISNNIFLNGFYWGTTENQFYDWIKAIIHKISIIYDNHNNKLIDLIIKYINDNYDKQIGLIDASEAITRNPSYVSRILNKELGKGFVQLLTEKRISEAKILLEKTTLKITEISEKVGYPNTKYFHQLFINKVGMTPADYREIVSTFK